MLVRVDDPIRGEPCMFNHASARIQVNEARIDELWHYRLPLLINRGPLPMVRAQHRWLTRVTKIQREITSWRKVWLAAITPMGKA